MKTLFAARGLPIVPHLSRAAPRVGQATRRRSPTRVAQTSCAIPVFVKPANLGSSVGISKAKIGRRSLPRRWTLALQFDRKIVIEAAVPNAREIECAVLGNDDPEASVPGEIVPSREFYDYEAKYLDEAARQAIIPAAADRPTGRARSSGCRIEAFRAVDCAGMARVDFLLARDTGEMFSTR